ncbi:MAG: CBS domain-containing protein [Phaeodactylibacter sp.]|nr:CBS domain-containing protein [Phaeodactylibacter sp.]MCB9291879.1 CBS domain-containing protein [Lewinellaceae bacterium]
MNQYPSVTKFMATKLITFTPETDIREAIDVILKKKISGAPILNEKRELVGMLSEVDCLRILLEGPYNEEPKKMTKVADYMSTSVKTISTDKTILDAAYEFVHSGFKRLPVTENGQLVGQISRVDVLRAIQKMEPHIKHVPDSWKGREPKLPDHKKSRFSENA